LFGNRRKILGKLVLKRDVFFENAMGVVGLSLWVAVIDIDGVEVEALISAGSHSEEDIGEIDEYIFVINNEGQYHQVMAVNDFTDEDEQ